MTQKHPPQDNPVNTPESWQVSEEETKRVWEQKSQEFSYFKERFKQRFKKTPTD